MIKFNEKYSINNGQGSIIFSEGKKGTVNATYAMSSKKDTGVINGNINGNILAGTYHNKIGNSVGLIEFTFNENGFECKWKQGIEPGPMRGKWKGRLNQEATANPKLSISERKIGVYTAVEDEDSGDLIASYSAEEMPYVIAIGFFGTHLPNTEFEWYGFVGYVISNTCDKCRTESVLFMNETGQTVSAHDMGGEALTEEEVDLIASFKEMYSTEWAQIQSLYDEYFYCSEEEQDNETLYLNISKNIPESLQLTILNQGDWLDFEEVKKNSGSSLGLMVELE
jgi:hypothetical protein